MRLSDKQHRRTVLLGSIGTLTMMAGCLGSDDSGDESSADTDATDDTVDDDSDAEESGMTDGEGDDDASLDDALHFGDSSTSWPRGLADHSNSGYLPGPTESMTSFERGLEIEAAVETAYPRYVFEGERLYSAFGDGTVRVYDTGGEEHWERSSDVAVGPYVEGDVVYAITSDDQLVAFDAASGDQEWIRPAPDDWEYADAAVVDGRVYGLLRRGPSDYVAGEYDIANDEVTWESDQVDEEPQELLITDGTLVVRETGSFHTGVRAIDIGEETPRWAAELEAQSMLVGGELLYGLELPGGVDADTEIHALSMADGTHRWSVAGSDELDPETTVTDGDRLYCATDEGYRALDGETGEVAWTFQLENQVSAGPFVTDETLYLAEDARVYALDPSDGSELGTDTVSDLSAVTTLTGYRDRLWVGGESRAAGRDLIALEQP